MSSYGIVVRESLNTRICNANYILTDIWVIRVFAENKVFTYVTISRKIWCSYSYYKTLLNKRLVEPNIKNDPISGAFFGVRDIPFRVFIHKQKLNYKQIVDHIRTYRAGSCSPKHYYLGEKLEDLGMEVTYFTFPFLWKDQPIDYPTRVRNLANLMPVQQHLCLGVQFEGNTQLIDATWDISLKEHGFNVNEDFLRGVSMRNAVLPCSNYIAHRSGVERWRYISSQNSVNSGNYEIVKDFYFELNLWLDYLRCSFKQ